MACQKLLIGVYLSRAKSFIVFSLTNYTMDNLPKEIIGEIAKHLDLQSQVRFKSVNRLCYRGIQNERIKPVPIKPEIWKSAITSSDWYGYGPLISDILKRYATNKQQYFVQWVIKEDPLLDLAILKNILSNRENIVNFTTEVYYYQTGEYDEKHWYILGKMRIDMINFYYFFNASCNYYGFENQCVIKFKFSKTLIGLIRFGLTIRERRELLH